MFFIYNKELRKNYIKNILKKQDKENLIRALYKWKSNIKPKTKNILSLRVYFKYLCYKTYNFCLKNEHWIQKIIVWNLFI